jgi:hypothetical protein
MLQVFLSRCCMCFTHMLQEFHLDVAYVTRMLHVFHLDVAYVFQWLHTCFSGVSDVYCKCSNCFRPMLHMFHLNVAIVDLVLHMLQWDPSVLAAYMHGCGGARAIGMGNGVGTNRDATPTWACTSMGNGVARGPM